MVLIMKYLLDRAISENLNMLCLLLLVSENIRVFLKCCCCCHVTLVLQTNIDQKLANSLHGLLNCEIGGLDWSVITTEYSSRVHCIHMYHLLCNALAHAIYSVVSGQYSYTIAMKFNTVYKR